MALQRILMVEDDPDIREVVATNLSPLGYQFDFASDGESAVEKALANSYALILLDVMLPKLGGIEVCQRIREKNSSIPILMLTAKGDELDRVVGLELGADDYLTKPFSMPELKARVKALLRRAHVQMEASTESSESNLLHLAEMTIDLTNRKVLIDEQAVELSAMDFDLLSFLARTPGRPYRRSELLEKIWGSSNSAYESNVNTQITRLRKKIEKDPSEPRFIKTVWGVGYRFAELGELERASDAIS